LASTTERFGMNTRRTILLGVVFALTSPIGVHAQPSSVATEVELKDVLRDFERTWNLHDTKAWSSFLTEDAWFTQAWDSYGRQKGRDSAVTLFNSNFLDSDLSLTVIRIRTMADGTATVAMRVVTSYLPKTDGNYRIVFEDEPAISRWRKVDGVWKMFFFTTDKGWALDQLKKDGFE
jgi:uncharacterized protein (TIGR02246 family)